jgi:hypothetical protein
MATDLEVEQKMRKRGKWLCRAGWGLFGAALALPALFISIMSDGTWWPGWECLYFTYVFAWEFVTKPEARQLEFGSFLFLGLAASNSIMIAGPLLKRWARKRRTILRRLAFVECAATLLVAYYAISIIREDLPHVGIGVYLWLISFVLVTAGTLHLALQSPNSEGVMQKRSGRTTEEIVALAELEAYLAGAAVKEGRNAAMPTEPNTVVETLEPPTEMETRTVSRWRMRHQPAHNPGVLA